MCLRWGAGRRGEDAAHSTAPKPNTWAQRSFVRRSVWQVGSRGEIGSSVNLMEQRSFGRVSQNVLNKSNIRHNNCRKQQILLLLLCCLNGSSKESRCWTRRRRVAFDLPSNVLEGNRNALAGNISRELKTKTYLTVWSLCYIICLWPIFISDIFRAANQQFKEL